METFRRDVRYAWRSLTRMRGLATAAIATLALGIGATTTMFGVVYSTLLREPPFVGADRLAILFNTTTTAGSGTFRLRWSRPQIAVLEQAVSSFESLGYYSPALVAISGRGDPEHADSEVASSQYFSALRVTPIAGRVFTTADDAIASGSEVTLISANLWRRRFAGDPSAIGATLRVNDVPLTIVGILPEGFAGLTGKAELWIPPPMAARLTYAEYLTTPQSFISVVARLKPSVTLAQASAEMAALAPRFPPTRQAASGPGTVSSAVAVRIADARIDPLVARSALVLLGAAACLLLVACVNVASLMLARGRMRRREMAIRLAIGSSRTRLIRQLLTEGLVLAAIAGIAGTIVATWGLDVFARTAPAVVASGRNNYGSIGSFGTPAIDVATLALALAVTLGTTMIFALAPALDASRADLTTALKDSDRGSGRQGRALSALVVSEVALACVLLTGSGLLLESFARLQQRRTGYDADQVLTFWIRPPASRYAPAEGPMFLDRLLRRLQAVPGVELAAVDRCTPFSGCARSVAFFPDRPIDPASAPGVGRHYISPDYFRALGIPLLAGRSIAATDRAGSPPVAVVNESGARRFWPGENPIGKRVWFGTTTGPFADPSRAVEVVGVVGDVKYESAEEQDNPAGRADFYTSYLQFAYPDTMVVIKSNRKSDRRSAGAASLVPAVRQAVASLDPSLPIYDVLTLDDRIDAALARPRFNAALLTVFASAALLLAAIGVYGVMTYSISSRVREIGVRVALGADARRVIALLVGEGLRLAAAGAAIGFVVTLAAARLLQGLIVGVSATDTRILGGAVIVMTAVAVLAAFVPARRAASVDPIIVLRAE